MSSYLKQFDLTFTSIGPVFIGSGEKRTSKEYVQGTKSVYFPDMERLYAVVRAKGLSASFEGFVMNTSTGGGQATPRLGDWLGRNGLRPDPGQMGGYPVRIGAIERGRDRRARGGRVITGEAPPLNEIHAFIKDAYGDPYIPGSSIKGLLRSIYLQHALSQQKPGPGHQQLRVPDRRSAQQQTGIQEEQRLLRRAGHDPSRPKDAVNDLFQAIRVSDSASLSLRSLEVVQKIDMNIHGEAGGLPLFREALSPGTEFVVRVSVDTSPLEHGGWPHGASFVEGIAAAAARVNEHRYAPYSAKYFDDEPIAGARVYLGGGAGYRSKTFVTDQADMARVLDEQFRSIKHKEKTMQLGVSPLVLKVTKAGEGNYEEMGLCELTVKKVKE